MTLTRPIIIQNSWTVKLSGQHNVWTDKFLCWPDILSLPAHASEQGNVIGSVHIYIAYYMSKSGIWLVISRVEYYNHEPKASANTAYEWNNIATFHDECNKWFILYFIFF